MEMHQKHPERLEPLSHVDAVTMTDDGGDCFFEAFRSTPSRFFLVDALAGDRRVDDGDDTLNIELFVKEKGGRSRTLHWVNRRLTFYHGWPPGADAERWGRLIEQVVREDCECRVQEKAPFIGFAADANGKRATRRVMAVTVASLRARRRIALALADPRSTLMRAATEQSIMPASTAALELYETRICPIQQALVAAGGRPAQWFDAVVAAGDQVDNVRFLPDLEEPPPPLRVLSYDIETAFARGCRRPNSFPAAHEACARIRMIGMTYYEGEAETHRVLCLGACATPVPEADDEPVEIVVCRDEADLLLRFAADIRAHDPDATTGWNTHGFDDEWLATKVELIGIMHRFADAAALVTAWRWATAFMTRFKTVARQNDRDATRAFLKKERQGVPWPGAWNTRDGLSADVTAARLALYRTDDLLLETWQYLRQLPSVEDFWRHLGRGDHAGELLLSTSRMGMQTRRLVMPGRIGIDLMQHVKAEFHSKLTSFTLKNCATYFGLPPKLDVSYDEMYDIFESGGADDVARVALYCCRDCVVPAKLAAKLCVWLNILELARVSGVVPSQLLVRGQ